MPRKKRVASDLSTSNEGAGSAWTGPFKIQLLPPSIIIEILSRLPIKTIFNCRCVCKAWLRLISHPRFAQIHLAKSPTGILIKTIPSVNDSKKISLTHVEERGRAPFQLDKLGFTPKINLPSSKFGLVNSCNGLLCLSGTEREDPIWVCNPILGEYITVPPASRGRQWGSFIGLGFCSVTNRYKVIQTFHPKVQLSGNDYLDAEIYYMDTGTWRSIGYAPCALVLSPFNSFLNGCLHWVSSTGSGAEYIYSFNFETEEFGSVPPPPCFDGTKRQFSNSLKLGIFKGCLFLCVFGDDNRKFDLWVMKDYGVKESWTKQFVIENLYPRQRSCDFYEPVKFLNNGEILMLYNDLEVVCYNTEAKRFRGTRVTRTRFEFNSIGLSPSFVSLYHVAKGELAQRVQGSKECSKLSAEGAIDCAGSGMSSKEPARFGSTFNQDHPGGILHFKNPDQRTEYRGAASVDYVGHVAAQGFSTPYINGVSGNLASKKSYPFF